MFRRLAVDNAILFIQYGASGLVSLLLIPHIVREIGLAAYGELAIAVAWGTFGALVVQYAFPLNGPKHIAQPRDGESHAQVVCRVTSAKLVLLGVVVLVLLVGALAVGPPGLAAEQWIVLLVIPAGFALNMSWYLQAVGRFFIVGLVSTVAVIASLAIGFGFVSHSGNVAGLMAAIALATSPLISGVGTLVLGSVALFDREAHQIRWMSPWGELREGLPLFLSQLTPGLYVLSGPIVIGTLLGVEEAGGYSAVERVMNAVVAAALLTHSAAYPRLAGLYRAHPAGYWKMLGAVIVSYMIFVLVVIGACLLAWTSVQTYLFGVANAVHDHLLSAALAWMGIAFFGPVLTSYLAISGQSAKVLSLNLRVIGLAFLIGIPGVLMWGAWAWIGALTFAQLPILAMCFRIWKSEFHGTGL